MSVTVRAACENYAKHVRTTKGDDSADDLPARFARWVDDAPMGGVANTKLTRRQVQAWWGDLAATPVVIDPRAKNPRARPRVESPVAGCLNDGGGQLSAINLDRCPRSARNRSAQRATAPAPRCHSWCERCTSMAACRSCWCLTTPRPSSPEPIAASRGPMTRRRTSRGATAPRCSRHGHVPRTCWLYGFFSSVVPGKAFSGSDTELGRLRR